MGDIITYNPFQVIPSLAHQPGAADAALIAGLAQHSAFASHQVWVPISPLAVSGASMQAIRIVTFCPLAVVTRMKSPSPTDTKDAGPAAAAAIGFGWLRLGAGAGAGAL